LPDGLPFLVDDVLGKTAVGVIAFYFLMRYFLMRNVAYLRARPTDPQLDDFGEEVLGDWPALGTRASEDK
jgi:hypothetical protein